MSSAAVDFTVFPKHLMTNIVDYMASIDTFCHLTIQGCTKSLDGRTRGYNLSKYPWNPWILWLTKNAQSSVGREYPLSIHGIHGHSDYPRMYKVVLAKGTLCQSIRNTLIIQGCTKGYPLSMESMDTLIILGYTKYNGRGYPLSKYLQILWPSKDVQSSIGW